MTNKQNQSDDSGGPLVRGPRVPGDDTTDLINTLIYGGESDVDPLDSSRSFSIVAKDAESNVPEVIRNVLNSPAGPELGGREELRGFCF